MTARNWFNIRAGAGATQVAIYDAIGGSDGISAEAFLDQIGKITGPIALAICSVGGDFFGGMLIADALRRRGGVTAHVTLAASIASAIALAADRVLIGEDGYFMVHAPWATTTGTADDMERMAGTLRKLRGTLADLYQRETGQSATTVAKWLDSESWFDGREAIKVGLADALDGQSSLKASIDLSRFKNPPAQLAAPAAVWGRVIAAKFVKAGC